MVCVGLNSYLSSQYFSVKLQSDMQAASFKENQKVCALWLLYLPMFWHPRWPSMMDLAPPCNSDCDTNSDWLCSASRGSIEHLVWSLHGILLSFAAVFHWPCKAAAAGKVLTKATRWGGLHAATLHDKRRALACMHAHTQDTCRIRKLFLTIWHLETCV